MAQINKIRTLLNLCTNNYFICAFKHLKDYSKRKKEKINFATEANNAKFDISQLPLKGSNLEVKYMCELLNTKYRFKAFLGNIINRGTCFYSFFI